MKLTVKTKFFDGSGCGPQLAMTPSTDHLITSACVTEFDDKVEIVIDVENTEELICTGSSPDSISFTFCRDDEWQGWFDTEVTVIGENETEIAKLKGNQFRQEERGQFVFLIVPWTNGQDDAITTVTWER